MVVILVVILALAVVQAAVTVMTNYRLIFCLNVSLAKVKVRGLIEDFYL